MLGTPPAFVLSQDQTLEFNLLQRSLVVWFFYFAWSFHISRCCLSITKNQLGLFVVSLYSFQGAFAAPFPSRRRSFPATALTVYRRLFRLSTPFFIFLSKYFLGSRRPLFGGEWKVFYYIKLTNEGGGGILSKLSRETSGDARETGRQAP